MLVAIAIIPIWIVSPATVTAASPAVNCAALALHLAPGLHPPDPHDRSAPPPDAPRTPFTIALPLYPGMAPLQHSAGSPFAEVESSPYLQTASAEFHAAVSIDIVQGWYARAMRACGWQSNGGWSGNAGAFPVGSSFARSHNSDTLADFGFNVKADGSTDVAVAVETVRYPVPPPRARIHGPFVQLRIADGQSGVRGLAQAPLDVVHSLVTNRQTIARIVAAIDAITAAFTVSTACFGRGDPPGPIWLTFIRANGTKVHAFEFGPGPCGGLAVNGFRWLLDPGTVWRLITPRAQVRSRSRP
jgi:hypothetical protein